MLPPTLVVKRDNILQINLIYFDSPHHKNKFVNSVNSLKKQFGHIGRNKKGNHTRLYAVWSA